MDQPSLAAHTPWPAGTHLPPRPGLSGVRSGATAAAPGRAATAAAPARGGAELRGPVSRSLGALGGACAAEGSLVAPAARLGGPVSFSASLAAGVKDCDLHKIRALVAYMSCCV